MPSPFARLIYQDLNKAENRMALLLPPRTLISLLIVFGLAGVETAQATWYNENIEDGADIVLMDLRWPWWPSGTYYANWNSGFNPKPNNLSFYGGFVASAPDGPGYAPNLDASVQSSFRPGNVWTFWGADSNGTPVRFTDVAPNLFIKNDYGGEGSSGTMGSVVWPFVKCREWYTMLARVWQTKTPADGANAYVGRWIHDLATHRWHLIGVARLPMAATSFTGNSGFIETLSNEKVVRPLHRRLGYYRKNGGWLKSDSISIDKTEYVVVNTVPEGDHEYVAIEYSNRPDLLPQALSGKPIAGDRKHTFTVRQPDVPTLDKPAVTGVRAETTGRQVAVSWEIPDTASPGFAYRIEVFGNPDCRGQPIAEKEDRAPTARTALIDAAALPATIRLTVTDVFDQTAPPVVIAAHSVTPPEPAPTRASTTSGLSYQLFHQDAKRRTNYFNPPLQEPGEEHHWLTLNEIGQGALVRSGRARGFDIGVREQRGEGYALVFRGFLRAPASGLYLLRAQIDGAYEIRLDADVALAWDGQHGTTEKAALRLLAQGDHSVVMTHLYDQLPASNFSVTWEGPNLPRQPIPVDALRVDEDRDTPVATIDAAAPGDGSGRVSVAVDPRAHTVNSTALFLGSLQLAQTNGPGLLYRGPLPRGSNLLWCRVVFDGSHTVDSDPKSLNVSGKPASADWTVRNVGDAKASAGLWQAGPEEFQFFGNGLHTVTRRVAGDFTATCRIDEYNGSRGEPVNPRAWSGLTAREFGSRMNWEWGQDFNLVQTVGDGLRASADFTDFGATRISSYELPKDRPWLRIVRQGNVWTAWSSTDGLHWELGAYQFRRARPEMDVGLFFSALPQDALAHYHARVSHLSIEAGAAPGSTPPPPTAARHTEGDRLTGVVVARSDPSVVVVRSTSKGLLRTTDGGKTWSHANGDLNGDDLSVRSVAIHPADPLTLVRAGGRGSGGSLWKSTDGGRTWARLPFTGDFDGVGPSALCGEIVAFDLRSPDTLYVGCESKGFFKSLDGGATWRRLGLDGERVTAVTVWPWERHYPATARDRTHLCVTTCPDHWMTFLGRGIPAVTTPNRTARGYVSNDNVETLSIADERADTGFLNVAFDKAMQSTGEMRYGTVHGLQAQVFAGSQMALYPGEKNLEWLRPITAVGATALGDQKFGRFITQALDPVTPGRLSRSEAWAFEWAWLPEQGAVPKGGLIAAAGDVQTGDRWWFVHTDGLFSSPDGGEHLVKNMDESGHP